MSTHPYLPLYVDDYEAATAHLTAEEDGIYNRLLRLCWRTPGCSMPNDPAWIARKVRLSPVDYARVAQPLIDEFFKIARGRLVQKRLKAEYDDISRKKAKRVKAGKAGGDAKALKTLTSDPSNATLLLGDMRAFPKPYPEPEREEDANASIVVAETPPRSAKPAKRTYSPAFEAAWLAYPHHKGRSSKPNASALFEKLPADERNGMVAAVERFAPNVGEVCGGKGAPDMAVWLKDGKHLNWQGDDGATTAQAQTWTGPPAVRASIVALKDEEFARKWVDPYCAWSPNDRTLLVANAYALKQLAQEIPGWCAANRAHFALAPANTNDAPLLAHGAAAA